MNDQEFDRILSSEGDLVPSSGFVSTVMDAVRSEACAPPPIPFPWMRALPGIAAGVLALVYLLIGVFRQSGQDSSAPSIVGKLLSSLTPAFRAAQTVGAGWIVAALLLAYISIKLSMLFARGKA
jgi:uncharacterized protein (DUF697 family)